MSFFFILSLITIFFLLGSKEKRQQSTIPSSFFQRGFESTVTEDSNKSDDMPSQSIKDITSGSVDAQIGTINLFAVPIVCLYNPL
jgi:hypothetical protein